MTIAIAIVAALGFLAMCLKTWTEFGQRTRQLKAEIEHNKRLVEDHSEHLESGRSQVDEIKAETETLLFERGELETQVLEQREAVSQLEQRLERTRPQSHRVDKSG